MKPEDFDEALTALDDAFAEKDNCKSWEYVAMAIGGHLHTIRTALRIAKAVCGEPSERAMEVGINQFYRKDIFKAMRDQMIKEAAGHYIEGHLG